MLVGATAVFAAVLVASMAHQATVMNKFSEQFALYCDRQNVESFEEMANATMPANASGYGAWIAAINITAKADGISTSAANGTLAISTVASPKAYAVIRLNT